MKGARENIFDVVTQRLFDQISRRPRCLFGQPPCVSAIFNDAIELKGEHLSHMANDELDMWESVEETAVEQAHHVKASLLI